MKHVPLSPADIVKLKLAAAQRAIDLAQAAMGVIAADAKAAEIKLYVLLKVAAGMAGITTERCRQLAANGVIKAKQLDGGDTLGTRQKQVAAAPPPSPSSGVKHSA